MENSSFEDLGDVSYGSEPANPSGGTIDLMVVCNYTACLPLLERQRMRVL